MAFLSAKAEWAFHGFIPNPRKNKYPDNPVDPVKKTKEGPL
jgi:hypothetical protein